MTEQFLEGHLLTVGKDLQPVTFDKIGCLYEIHLEASARLGIAIISSGIERCAFLLSKCDTVALEDSCHVVDYETDGI